MDMAIKFILTLSIIIILLYLHIPISQTYIENTREKPRKIIIDTDAGGDDALAILLALMYEIKTQEIEILAITCTYGNTYLKNVEQNVLKILTIANRNDIPVYSGTQKPLLNTYHADNFFGEDGFGDFNFTKKITGKVNRNMYASVLLIDLVKRYPNEITIITLGPLTNIGTAIALEPRFLHLTKQLMIMGSYIDKSEVLVDKLEFNFRHDPESNWMTFNNTNKLHKVLPINAVNVNPISKEERREIFNNLDNSIADFLYQAERKSLEITENWEPSDGITMAIMLKSEIITQSFEVNLKPVIVGDTRGAVKTDMNDVKNAVVIEKFNMTAFKNLLLEYLS